MKIFNKTFFISMLFLLAYAIMEAIIGHESFTFVGLSVISLRMAYIEYVVENLNKVSQIQSDLLQRISHSMGLSNEDGEVTDEHEALAAKLHMKNLDKLQD